MVLFFATKQIHIRYRCFLGSMHANPALGLLLVYVTNVLGHGPALVLRRRIRKKIATCTKDRAHDLLFASFRLQPAKLAPVYVNYTAHYAFKQYHLAFLHDILPAYIAHELSQNKKDIKNNEQRLKCGSYLTLKAKEFRNIRKKKRKGHNKKVAV